MPSSFDRRVAQHRRLVGVAQPRRVEDVVHRRFGPGKRIVGAHHDAVDADLGDQGLQRLGREDDGVVVELLQIFGRLLLQRHAGAAVREGDADGVRARRVERQIAAAVRRANLQAGEAVERAFIDQMRQRERGLERIADGVFEPAVALEPRCQLLGADRMDEDEDAELLALRPDRMKFRIGELQPSTLPPTDMPRRPSFLMPYSSCCTARSGCCIATVAKATKRSGCAATSSASFSFCSLISCFGDVAVGVVPERD